VGVGAARIDSDTYPGGGDVRELGGNDGDRDESGDDD
jgi:hypothetical protein